VFRYLVVIRARFENSTRHAAILRTPKMHHISLSSLCWLAEWLLFLLHAVSNKNCCKTWNGCPQKWTQHTQSVWRWATGWTIGVLGFDSRLGLGIFLFTTASRTALGPTQPPIQWVTGALSLGLKRPGREADYSPPSSSEVKEWVELYFYSPNTPS
jgi:hypothetical protein